MLQRGCPCMPPSHGAPVPLFPPSHCAPRPTAPPVPAPHDPNPPPLSLRLIVPSSLTLTYSGTGAHCDGTIGRRGGGHHGMERGGDGDTIGRGQNGRTHFLRLSASWPAGPNLSDRREPSWTGSWYFTVHENFVLESLVSCVSLCSPSPPHRPPPPHRPVHLQQACNNSLFNLFCILAFRVSYFHWLSVYLQWFSGQ